MNRRNAISLIEVLAALFVMGIGLMALLTLFPLGVLSMAQAIKDGRAAQAANMAEEVAEMQDLRHDGNCEAIMKPQGSTAPLAEYPSMPVYCDPIGYMSFGGTLGGAIPRVQPALVQPDPMSMQTPQSLTMRWFTLLDDMVFDVDGTPAQVNGMLERQELYSWAYMMQRPRIYTDYVVNLTIVVYQGRGLTLKSGTNAGTETPYSAQGSAGSNTITVFSPTAPCRRNTWILDCTTDGAGSRNGPVHANFYRVVAVTTTGGQSILEVQQPLKMNVNKIIVMDNVVEVFEKGPGRNNKTS